MTPDAQRLVRDSFAKIAPNAEATAGMFYDRLFVLDPSLRSLFKGDMAKQGRKLMTVIGTAVAISIHWRRLCRRDKTSADAISAMASSRRIIRLSQRHCSGL